MANADFDGFGGSFSTTGQNGTARVQRYVNIAGALCSAALVVGLTLWGYKLAVRDVSGVPVVAALEGPMRVAPDNPGGSEADYQGLAVNEVAAVGAASPPAERLILAPRPVELTLEDASGLQGQPVPDLAPAAAMISDPDLALAAVPLTESADPTEVAVAAALAEALAEGDPAAGIDPAPDLALIMEPVDASVLTRSLRPKLRPTGAAPEMAEVAVSAKVAEVDPATLAVGTRLVQFGAFDTVEEAKVEWSRLRGKFTELMAGKAMVVQPAESGGRTFYRLRAHGFEDEADARRFCSAFIAENAACIPVAQR